jgi:hypothetical protein
MVGPLNNLRSWEALRVRNPRGPLVAEGKGFIGSASEALGCAKVDGDLVAF